LPSLWRDVARCRRGRGRVARGAARTAHPGPVGRVQQPEPLAKEVVVSSSTAAAGATEASSFPGERPVTPEVVREHNLNELEYGRIVEMLGRTPTLTELGVFSALWSEHCSYKHSKSVLKSFPTTGAQVVQ